MSAVPTLRIVQDVIDAYLLHAKAVGLFCAEALADRERTLLRGTRRNHGFAQTHGQLAIEECRRFHLSQWIESNPRWRSSSTRKAKANQVNAAFNWAAREGLIASNPFAGVNYDEADPRPPMRDDELDALLGRANKCWERAVRFLRLTGCRLSDVCRMRWRDVDWPLAAVLLHKHKSRKKSKKPKVLVLIRDAAVLLFELWRLRYGTEVVGSGHGDDYVFLNNKGTPWNRGTLGQHLRRLKERYRLDMPATLHGLRHQVGTQVIKNKGSLKLLSKGLSHSSSAVTERFYVHLDEEIEAVRETMELGKPKGW
jgi:integrase